MKKKLQKTLIATAAMSACLLVAVPTAAEAAVSVTLPTFDVTLNGTTIENANRQYPLLVYKDITYVPMTYHDCRFLGLETTWNQQDGLGIIKSGMSGAYYEDTITKKNNKRAAAQLVTGKVEVNGKQINNSSEKYPLLLYRDVTYFPLTWRYAVDEFGWKYHFDSKNGLVISSTNQKTDSLTIKDGRDAEYADYIDFDFSIDTENLYYQGKKGEVYQRPLNDWNNDTKRKTTMQIPYEDDYFTGYAIAEFKLENNNVYCSYHSGGATFGGDILYRITDGKPVQIKNRNYDSYTDFGDFMIQIQGPAIGGYPMVPMTLIASDGTKSSLGPSGYYFRTQADSYDEKRNVLYVKACQLKPNSDRLDKEYLYAVSLKDGSLEKLSERNSYVYAVAKDILYYVYEGTQIYAKNLDTGKETAVTSNYRNYFAPIDRGVYFGTEEDGKALCFWDAATETTTVINANGNLAQLSNQNGYVIARFTETTDNHSRILVFDANGKQVYTSADVASKAVINADGVLVYRLAGTAQLVKVQL